MGCGKSSAVNEGAACRPPQTPWSIDGEVSSSAASASVWSAGSPSDTLGRPVDDHEIQVFYEYAVDRATSSSSRRVPTGRQFSKGKTRTLAPLKDYFLTADRLSALAAELGFQDLGSNEIARIFEKIPKDENGKVGREQFKEAVKTSPEASSLQILVRRWRKGFAYGFDTPEDYDFTRPSSDNYRKEGRAFTPEYADIRGGLDYSYHNNYSEKRQQWQDEVIKSTVVRGSPQPSPWLVFTCGAMGVGKGYCMSWMSKRGFFPLEDIVHVDADAFKLMMPEWPQYVKHKGDDAGTLCHMESSLMMEIAQWAAMQKRQNTWIDGSLRNAAFYAKVFEDIRHRYPHYKISIMYIYADEAVIRERIKVRAERTGRNIPEHLIVASLGAMDKALNTLTPLCDFVARIDNSGEVPVLAAFETIDTKGSWKVVADRFARKFDGAGEFPVFLAPLPLVKLDESEMTHLRSEEGKGGPELHLVDVQQSSVSVAISSSLHSLPQTTTRAFISGVMARLHSHMFGQGMKFEISPMAKLTLSARTRTLAGIPDEAALYFWVFPFGQERQDIIDVPHEERKTPFMQLIHQGGFCYCSEKGEIVAAHAISSRRERTFLQFDSPETLRRSMIDNMRKSHRLQPVESPYFRQRGAREFGWVMPNEVFGNERVGGDFGAFAYVMEGRKTGLLFQVMSA